MDAPTLATIGGGVAAVIGAAALLTRAIARPLRKLSRDNDEFREDWYGQPARPGRGRQAGVMERLGSIEAQMHPNGGSTMRDAINLLATRLDDHIRSHGGGP